MDPIEFQKLLDGMSLSEMQDFLEDIWHGKIGVTFEQEEILKQHIKLMRVNKTEKYIMVWLVLLAMFLIDAGKVTPITGIFGSLPEPEPTDEFDLIWVTEGDIDVCPLCTPLEGKKYPEETTLKPKLHPGCRCELEKVPKGARAMMHKIRTSDGGAVRAVLDGKKRILEVLAAPFGSPSNLDRYDQYFTARTDFMIEVGDRRPTLYLHGFSPRKRLMKNTPTLGVATVSRIDEQGLWMQTELDNSELATRTWKSALLGNAKASTGSIPHLVRPPALRSGKWPPGPVLCWPLVELSIYDGETGVPPASEDAIVLPLRALFEEHSITLPDNFEAGEDKKYKVAKRNLDLEGDIEMDPKELKKLIAEGVAADREAVEAVAKAKKAKLAEKETAMRALIEVELAETAMRAKIEAELLKENPNYRPTFNINKIGGDKGLDEIELENFSYVRSVIEDAQSVFHGGQPALRASALALEETEVGEIGPMVPEDMLNKIHALLGKYSLVDKLEAKGLMTIYKTDKLIFNVPVEVTALAALADIAEEGAYTANTPEFVNAPVTMQKVGNYISVTEESLEDQDLFQQWLVKAVAKAIALSKNADLHTLMDATAGTAIGTTDVITDAEVIAMYYSLAQEYRDGGCFIMNDLTLAYIRAMLITTPRAYGEFGFNAMSMGELGERFLNKLVFTNANWVALIGGATNDAGVTFADLDEMIVWVERRKFSIFVDPYSTKLSAGTVNFLPSARYAGVTVNAAAHAGIELLS